MSERHFITVGHIWRHWPSSDPVLSKMADMKFLLLKLNVSFWRNKIDNVPPLFKVLLKKVRQSDFDSNGVSIMQRRNI